MRSIIFCLLLLLPLNAHAFSFTDFFESFRPHLEQVFGEGRVERWFPTSHHGIELPPIPAVNQDSRSTATYERVERPDHYDEEERRKYNFHFITELYKVVRNERANRNHQAQWLNTLTQGGSREGVYRAIVLDNTYAGMENYGPNATDELQTFTMNFMEKYLDRNVNPSSLQGVNFYTLKRIVTDHTLNVIGELLSQEDHLERWYAIFSEEVARNYPELWENPVRQERDARYHLQWAQRVPTQHLKSEVIIKLHTVMNFYQGI